VRITQPRSVVSPSAENSCAAYHGIVVGGVICFGRIRKVVHRDTETICACSLQALPAPGAAGSGIAANCCHPNRQTGFPNCFTVPTFIQLTVNKSVDRPSCPRPKINSGQKFYLTLSIRQQHSKSVVAATGRAVFSSPRIAIVASRQPFQRTVDLMRLSPGRWENLFPRETLLLSE